MSPKCEIGNFEALCREAVLRHGDDWANVERFVTEQIAGFPSAQRDTVLGEVARTLEFSRTNP